MQDILCDVAWHYAGPQTTPAEFAMLSTVAQVCMQTAKYVRANKHKLAEAAVWDVPRQSDHTDYITSALPNGLSHGREVVMHYAGDVITVTYYEYGVSHLSIEVMDEPIYCSVQMIFSAHDLSMFPYGGDVQYWQGWSRNPPLFIGRDYGPMIRRMAETAGTIIIARTGAGYDPVYIVIDRRSVVSPPNNVPRDVADKVDLIINELLAIGYVRPPDVDLCEPNLTKGLRQ